MEEGKLIINWILKPVGWRERAKGKEVNGDPSKLGRAGARGREEKGRSLEIECREGRDERKGAGQWGIWALGRGRWL